MPSLKSIRRRIASVKSTQKITRAMKMVAAARLRRAQQRITELRPYAQKTAEVLRSVASRAGEDATHPLLEQRPVKTVLLFVLTSDRGLAGAFNSSIQRAAEKKIRELREEGFTVLLATLGHARARTTSQAPRHRGAARLVGAPEGKSEEGKEIAR
ncbi:MAG: F0F1 ATP synthase subunit gamma [Polyangiales bacterium]